MQYGQKPEGRTVAFPSTHPPRTAAPTTASAAPQGPLRGRPPIATFSANPEAKGGEVVKIAQLASIAGPQSRVAQPETPVTLQFQGSKFTLSHSQLRQLTAGQPLQLQGSVLQIVSAPGQPYLRAPGPVVMQTVSQAGAVHGALGSKPLAGGPSPAPLTPQVGVPGRVAVNALAVGEPGTASKPASPIGGPTQEEKTRLLKERLDQIYLVNERRCSQAPVYGRDLLRICALPGHGRVQWRGSLDGRREKEAGPAHSYASSSESPSELMLTLCQCRESLQDVIDRYCRPRGLFGALWLRCAPARPLLVSWIFILFPSASPHAVP